MNDDVTTTPDDAGTTAGTDPVGTEGAGLEGGAEPQTVGSDDQGQAQATADWTGAPDNGYTDEGIEMPEGYELDENVAGSLAEACHEMGLSQKAFSNIITKMTPVLEKQQADAIQAFKSENYKAFLADKELGGSRARESLETANAAYKNLVPQDLQDIFARTGLNTHPAMIKMFHSLAKSMSDDTVVRGGRAGGESLANFFNNSKMN